MEWYTAAERFTEALASSDPTPGGGAAAAHAGATGCALAIMAIATTLKRKATSAEVRIKLEPSLKKITALKNELKNFVRLDAEAYSSYMLATRLPKDNPEREKVLQQATAFAAKVPCDTATTALTALQEIENIKDKIAPIILSDIYCAQHLLKCAIRCSVENITINLSLISDEDKRNELEKQISIFLKSC